MSTELTTINQDAINAFLEQESASQRGSGQTFLNPMKIEFNGQLGKYFKRYWDDQKKEMVKEEFVQTWAGTILNPIFHYYKWKYDPKNTKITRKTREFSDFDSQIELLKIDYNEEDKSKRTTSLGFFNGLEELKAKYGIKDPDTGAVKFPWDLNESVYIYVHELDVIVNFHFDSSSTREAFWNYQKESVYKSINGVQDDTIKAFAQVKTRFGTSDVITHPTLKNDDGTPKQYYSGTFSSVGLNTQEELMRIMDFKTQLSAWMQSFKTNKSEPAKALTETDVVKALPAKSEGDIDLSSIPF